MPALQHKLPTRAGVSRPGLLHLLAAAIWVLFCFGVVTMQRGDKFGDDFAGMYHAGALYERGDLEAIYVPGPTEQPSEDTPPEADRPTTQPPLIVAAFGLVASALSFGEANRLFLLLNLSAYALALLLGLRLWRPEFSAPRHFVILLALATLSSPLQNAAWLNQIQMIVVLLLMLAITLEHKGHYRLAGAAAALATISKVSPGILVVAWLCAGKFRAAGWTTAFVVALAGISIALCGVPLHEAYLAQLSLIANQVMMKIGGSSLVSFFYNYFYWRVSYHWLVFTLPADIRWLNRAACVLTAVGLAVLTIRLRGETRARALIAFALASTLILPPIVWDFYSILMPMLLMAVPPSWFGDGWARRGWRGKAWSARVWVVVCAIVVFLDILPIVPILIALIRIWQWPILVPLFVAMNWAQLYAAVILSVALVVLARPDPGVPEN